MNGERYSMRKEIYLTQENKTGDVVGLTAFHINGLGKLKEFPELVRLKLTGGKIEDFTGLQYCPKLSVLEIGLTEIGDFSSLGANQSIKELTVAGYYENVIETAWKMNQLESLSVIYGTSENPGKLKNLKKLRCLYLDKVRNSSDLMGILSLINLTRLKVNVPKKSDQEEIDTFLTSLKEQLPKLNWLELGLQSYEFHLETLSGLKLKHFSVTGKNFTIA